MQVPRPIRIYKKLKTGTGLNLKDKSIIRVIAIISLTAIVIISTFKNGFSQEWEHIILMLILYISGVKVTDILPEIIEKDQDDHDEQVKEKLKGGKNGGL